MTMKEVKNTWVNVISLFYHNVCLQTAPLVYNNPLNPAMLKKLNLCRLVKLRFFHYDYMEKFTKVLFDGKLGEIPYANINGTLYFSRTKLNDWLWIKLNISKAVSS